MALYKKWLTKTELEAEANQIIDEDFSDTENQTSGSEDEEDVVEVEEEDANDDENSSNHKSFELCNESNNTSIWKWFYVCFRY
jgi:hypothetical protein